MQMDLEMEMAGQPARDNVLSDAVINKYKVAADICNNVLKHVLLRCVPGADILELCRFGDREILQSTASIFRKDSGLEKGIASPTTVCVNGVAMSFSPLAEASAVLGQGDIVNVELGVHIDGYIATAAHTVVVVSSELASGEPLLGKGADAIIAAYHASEVALRMIRPGARSDDIKAAIQRVAGSFEVQPLESTSSFLMSRYVLEGENHIPNEPYDFLPKEHTSSERTLDVEEDSAESFTLGENQVIGINIMMSSGSGKMTEVGDAKTTIFQRDVSRQQSLRMRASRRVLSKSLAAFSIFPFSTRALFDLDQSDAALRLGLPECVNEGVLVPLPVMEDKSMDVNGNPAVVAQFKMTVLVTSNGVMRITAGSNLLGLPYCHSPYSLGADFQHILQRNVKGVKAIKARESMQLE